MEFGIFVTYDDYMTENYSGFLQKNEFPVFSYSLPNYSGGPISTLLNRIRSRRRLKEKTQKLVDEVKRLGCSTVYLAASEGYVSANAIPMLRKHLPELKFISLQHGMFDLKYRLTRELAVRVINACTSLFLGIKIIGRGFGGIRTDRYYVYNDAYREFLINRRGWPEPNVVVDMSFLKPEFAEVSDSRSYDGEAVLFLQPLADVGLCSRENESRITQKIIDYLADEHSELIVKKHPKSSASTLEITLPSNARYFNQSRIPRCRFAYSFFSTALLEAEHIGSKITAIRSKDISVKSTLYDQFPYVLSYEEVILPKLKRNSKQTL